MRVLESMVDSSCTALDSIKGTDSRILLRGSLKYFQELCRSEEAGQMRLESINEAAPRLTKMLSVLEEAIADADHQISAAKKAIEDERKSTMAGFLAGLSDPQLQTVSKGLERGIIVNGCIEIALDLESI